MASKKSRLISWLGAFWERLRNFVTDGDTEAEKQGAADYDLDDITKGLDALAETTAYAMALAEEKQDELREAIKEHDAFDAEIREFLKQNQRAEAEKKAPLRLGCQKKVAALEADYRLLAEQAAKLLASYREKKSAATQIAQAADELVRRHVMATISAADRSLTAADLEQIRDRLRFEALKLEYLAELEAADRGDSVVEATARDDAAITDPHDPIATARRLASAPSVKRGAGNIREE